MDLGLTGRIALVTGASRGIGRSIATVLAREGARVAICARNEKPLQATAEALRKDGGDIYAATADISRPGDVERVVEGTVSRWGGLDILVNNAGGPPPGRFEAIADSDWEGSIQLTLLSVVRAIRAALPWLKSSPSGRIINILSTSVKEPIDGMLLSNSLRNAVAGLARTVSRELGAYGITVNNVCPGHILTGRLREIAAYRASQGETVTPAAALARIPLARLGSPEEVAGLVAFLASHRGGYITDTTIPVDGGSTSSLT